MNDGLQVTDLWKSYGSIDVLKGISLHIRPGEIYDFVGANGAGKSTTMRTVIGVTAADAGEVSWLALIQRTEDLHSTQAPDHVPHLCHAVYPGNFPRQGGYVVDAAVRLAAAPVHRQRPTPIRLRLHEPRPVQLVDAPHGRHHRHHRLPRGQDLQVRDPQQRLQDLLGKSPQWRHPRIMIYPLEHG